MKQIFSSLLLLAGVCASTCASAADTSKAFTSLALPKSDFPLHIHAANFLPESNQLCLVGSHYDDMETKSFARLILLDLKQKKIVWDKAIAPGKDDKEINFIDCVKRGDYFYAIANASFYNSNTTYASIYKFDSSGKKLKAQDLEIPGGQAFALTANVNNNQINIAGATQEVNQKENMEYYSVFLASVDENMKVSTKLIKKGGFHNGAAMRFVDKNLYVGGNFYPQKLAAGDSVDDYANAKISAAGNYVWSTRPQPEKSKDVVSTIDANANITSLSNHQSTTVLRTVDAAGKVQTSLAFESKYCKTDELAQDQDLLYVIRKSCDEKKKRGVLLEINIKSGKEREIAVLKNEAQNVFVNQGHLYVITKDANANLTLEFN